MRLRYLLCLLALVPTGSHAASGQEPTDTIRLRATSASGDQIARWVKELDADRFIVRRTATEKLILAGEPVIKPIERVLAASNLEVATRGVFVLRQLALCGDVPTEEAATETLRKIADRRGSSAARIAADTIAALDEVRQQRAIEELGRLGARIDQDLIAARFQRQARYSIEIGSRWQGTAADLQRLKWFNSLHMATFDGQRTVDTWIEPIQHAQDLQKLVIRHASVTDAAIRSVRDLEQLAFIDLMYTPVTDACLDDLLRVKNLRVLRIIGTRVSSAGAERFQAAATHVEVDYKNGAFLGVRCQPPPWPCEVTVVTPGSAAAIGGVRRGDVIVRYAGESISDFVTLRERIARNYVGDTVAVHVARQGKTVHLKCSHKVGQKLGIEGRTSPFGCEVTKVVPGGEAASAGIRVGDVISILEDVRVIDLDQLNKIYEQRKANGNAAMEIVRGTKIVKLEVTFGEWKE